MTHVRMTTVVLMAIMFTAVPLMVAYSKEPSPTTRHATMPTTQGVPAVDWGSTSSGCRIGISCNRGTYVAGEAIDLNVEVQNNGSGEICLYMQGEPTRDQFEVIGKFADGKLVPTTKYGTRRPHEGSDVVLHLASGKTSSPQSIRINRILDLSCAGEYVIAVKAEVGRPYDDDLLRLESQQIKIKIGDHNEEN